MSENVVLGGAESQMLNEMVLDHVMELSSDPKYTKPMKYDKEAWRGEDQDSGEEQHFSKPIDLTF
jgi:hypothetical protein